MYNRIAPLNHNMRVLVSNSQGHMMQQREHVSLCLLFGPASVNLIKISTSHNHAPPVAANSFTRILHKQENSW